MSPKKAAEKSVSEFLARWEPSGASERANYQIFLTELCDLLEVPRPDPATDDAEQNRYTFDYPVKFNDGFNKVTTNFIDLYRREAFVLETKQGSEQKTGLDETGLPIQRKLRKGTAVRNTEGWNDAMLKAKGQAEQYARALPSEHGWPPFLVVIDIGHSIELYADFSRAGRTYVAFPDPASFRIKFRDLEKPEIRELLKQVWLEPLALDPTRRSAQVTREVAANLAELAKSLERSGYEAGQVAQFLMRCLFTMFAEDVGLLPADSFKNLLKSRRGDKLKSFKEMLESLWKAMDKGEFTPILDMKVLRFNGDLFKEGEALPVNMQQLELLILAAESDWKAVEPAIFGTLLERALDPHERHKLGAHYTPRAYVERLVMPTIIEPLREEWESVKAAAITPAKKKGTKDAFMTWYAKPSCLWRFFQSWPVEIDYHSSSRIDGLLLRQRSFTNDVLTGTAII